ncbi:hypothetical protein PM082_012497 [Marasmius tenuissimus]|nr:hypothetical protein PM082_012497 [Marasmius tenuissimus]
MISVKSTFVLRWVLVPICLCVSWMGGVLLPGLGLALSFVAYNEGGLHYYWYSKILLNTVGLTFWDAGAAMIAGKGQPNFDKSFEIAFLFCAGIVLTTSHVQDFQDELGDRLSGRTTLPTLLPEGVRYITSSIIIFWSVWLGWYWGILATSGYLSFVAIGIYLSLRIFFQRSKDEDTVTFKLFMVWYTCARALCSSRTHRILLGK